MIARLAGIACVAALVAAGVAVGGGGAGEQTVTAEFTNARGLLEGNEVRIAGAPAGSVDRIELTPRNTALVTVELNGSAPAIRADAAAAIRPVDLLGDVYLSLSPGTSDAPLQRPIATARTSNAPRLDELLRVFEPSVRDGLQALFVELGIALERRGEDLGRAIVELRPALAATDAVMTELASQNAGLRRLITDAEHFTGQLARRRGDLGTTVDALAATLRETATVAPALERGVERMPATLARLTTTLAQLERTARAAQPLATVLGDAAPQLASAAGELEPFLDAARPAVRDTRPLVGQLRNVLRKGSPALQRLATGSRALSDAAPELGALMDALVPAAGPISDGFFVNFPDQAAEPGTQPFDPTADPRRHYWRGAAVFTCEAFGLPIQPDCLLEYLRDGSRRRARAPRRERPGTKPAVTRPATPKLPDVPAAKLPALPGPVRDAVQDAIGAAPVAAPEDLLDFLLRP